MIYCLVAVVAIISPFFAIAEPVAVLSGLSSKTSWFIMAVALTIGQTTGFSLMYFFGDRFVARWQWLAKKLENVNLEEYAERRHICTAMAALFGLPPLTALALAGRIYERQFRTFLVITFAGRFVRFCTLAGAASYFERYVDSTNLPLWLKPYF